MSQCPHCGKVMRIEETADWISFSGDPHEIRDTTSVLMEETDEDSQETFYDQSGEDAKCRLKLDDTSISLPKQKDVINLAIELLEDDLPDASLFELEMLLRLKRVRQRTWGD